MSLLIEEIETFVGKVAPSIDTVDDIDTDSQVDLDYNLDDIIDFVSELSQNELNIVGDFLVDMFAIDEEESEDDEEEIEEDFMYFEMMEKIFSEEIDESIRKPKRAKLGKVKRSMLKKKASQGKRIGSKAKLKAMRRMNKAQKVKRRREDRKSRKAFKQKYQKRAKVYSQARKALKGKTRKWI
jgi:hypothetical protein